MFSLNDPGWGRNSGSGGGGGDGQRPRPSGDGPPDLDELWRDFNRRLNGMFGRRGGGGSPPPGDGQGPSFRGAGMGAGVMALVALLLWLGSGFYIVPEGQAAAILRFGEFKYLNDRAGFTWRIPYPIETAESYRRLVDEFGMTQEAVARRVGKDRATVTFRDAAQFKRERVAFMKLIREWIRHV